MSQIRSAALIILVQTVLVIGGWGQVASLHLVYTDDVLGHGVIEGENGYFLYGDDIFLYDLSGSVRPVRGPALVKDLTVTTFLVQDGIGYLAVANAGLLVYDFTDPNNPNLLGRASDVPADDDYVAMEIAGSYLLTAGKTQMRMVDISDPNQPEFMGRFGVFGNVGDLSIDGNLAYLLTEVGLHIIDISYPPNMTEVGFHVISGTALDAQNGFLVIAEEHFGRVYDTSDPMNLVEVGSFSRGIDMYDVMFIDSLTFFLDRVGLSVADLSNPSDPVPLGKGFGRFDDGDIIEGSSVRDIFFNYRGNVRYFAKWRYNGIIPPCPRCAPTPGECDSGYYLLDSLGGRHRVGNPADLTGPIYFGRDIARDLEIVRIREEDNPHPLLDNLAVLDGLGAVHLVTGPSGTISQEFYFPEDPSFPEGRAVDLEMSFDGEGFWVLTDFGGIYRAGSTKGATEEALVPGTDRTSVLGFDIPFGTTRNPGVPNPGGASLRAVSLNVLDTNRDSNAEAYVVLDSQGGRFHLGSDGSDIPEGFYNELPVNDPLRLADPSGYVWPFFPGLDIARDSELEESLQGLIVLDGWDGIHPVPVDIETNPVYFANNRVSDASISPGTGSEPTPRWMVGLPYVKGGFDNPSTDGIDEGNPDLIGIDAAAIFTDLEFTRCAEGLYTLDKFGGVFALGNAREDDLEVSAPFGNSPYFFPFLYAEDMEVLGIRETMFRPAPPAPLFTGCETDFCAVELPLPNLPAGARPLRFVRVPAGSFMMGSPETELGRDRTEGPLHEVTIEKPFYISETEITQAQFESVLGFRPWSGRGGVLTHPDAPASYVNWPAAWEFAVTLNSTEEGLFRLPSEAEWEYACRAGTDSEMWFGFYNPNCDGRPELACTAAFAPYLVWQGSDVESPLPVGGRFPNPFGLLDMNGNVWEWVNDTFHDHYGGAPIDGSPWLEDGSGGTIRGGAFNSPLTACRSASRSGDTHHRASSSIGFRIVREID